MTKQKKYQHGFRVRFDGNQKKVMEVHELLKTFCKKNKLNLGFYSQTGQIVKGQIVKKKEEKAKKKKKGWLKKK